MIARSTNQCAIPGPRERFVMSKILNTTARAAIVALSLSAMGVAQGRPINYQHHFHAGYAGPVYSKAPRELWPWNVPGRGVAGIAPQFNNPGPQIIGYGCLAHPDYGLYTPHFC
jgi:hypothetical protein